MGEATYAAVPHLVRIHRKGGIADWNTYAIVAIIELAREKGDNPRSADVVERRLPSGDSGTRGTRCRKFGGFYLFLFQTPHDSERVATFAGRNESALFHRLDGIAIGRQRADFFIVLQPPQDWVAAERISFKLVSVLDVRK